MRHSLHVDIPLLLRFTSAKRHDSVSFLVAFHEFEKHMPDLHISNMCLDSAMDNYPTYNLLKDRHIHAFIDLKAKCGRRKCIPDNIHIDKDGTPICQQGERMALNTPIQGSAADILKKAMVEIYAELKKRNLKSKMLIQVHDELVLNVYQDELNEVKELVRNIMENTYPLDVPLKVDIETGSDWYDAK